MSGRWVLCDSQSKLFCEQCGNFTNKAWLWYPEPTTYTSCVCESCAEALLK